MAENSAEVASEPGRPSRSARVLVLPVLGCMLLAAGLACAWHYTDLGDFTSVSKVARAARDLGESPLGPVYVVLAFVAGAAAFVPSTALIAGTVLAFGATRGFACAMAGCMLSAALGYGTGRLLAGRLVAHLSGERLTRLRKQLCTRAFHATLIARLMPVGNYTAVNMLAGSLRVPFGSFLLGNLVGVLPYVVVLALFANRLRRLLSQPSLASVAWLAASLVVMAGVAWGIRRYVRREEAEDGQESGASTADH